MAQHVVIGYDHHITTTCHTLKKTLNL
jgi:hypothetical protein